MILALKTAGELSELYLLDNTSQPVKIIQEKKWRTERELGKTLLETIEQFLQARGLQGIDGLIVFRGPGSFTGLRIGIATMNTIAYAKNLPIVGTAGDNWLKDGVRRFKNGENDKIVTPKYGSEPKITKAKK
jgi:tRNA threonylcarbamoyladenosine biosynthesis protein TsaB